MAAHGRFPPLDLTNSTVLITGGSGGIGYGMAARFVKAGSTVIITGRNKDALESARARLPGVHAYVSDVTSNHARQELIEWSTTKFPDLNILVNNAGMQRVVPLKDDNDFQARQQEIAANLEGPIHLASLITPHLLKQKQAAIVNITSGLAFIPCAFAPLYGATKAALHSYTVAMRPHYADSSISIVEIAPPPVKTNLPSSQAYGEDCDAFCDHAFGQFEAGHQEIGYKLSEDARLASREELDKRFEMMTGRSFKGPTY